MEDVEVLCRFGTPLEPLEEDEIPSKKPILIEDQIVTDENGRRRFHGAFTGGFSAGFWNTVGSLEGWTPKEFKSSRDEKFKIQQQKPTDFMDDEDFGEFGFAPQRVQTTADFTSKKEVNEDNSKKRKHNKNKDGPIPGIPVLQQLLEPSKDNIAIRLLKKMGWKEGQGIGARQTKSEKKSSAKHNFKEQYILKKYGCDMGPIAKADSIKSNSDSESDISDIDGITFAPDDFEPYICAAKDNCFGLGYVGLSREPVLKQHINLFGPLELLDNNKQKLSIRGKGFGVGALEEEDEDIYHHDDLSNYDFSLDKPSNQKHKPIPKPQDFHIIDGFSGINETNIHTKKVFVVKIPPNFTPRNWLFRKSRFEPLDEKRAAILKQQDEVKIKGLGRHDITLDERKEILEGTSKKSKNEMINNDSPIEKEKGNKKQKTYLEKINEKYKIEDNKKDKVLNMLVAKSDNFVKSEIIKEDGTILKEGSSILSIEVQTENENIINEAKKITKHMDTNSCGSFKPFLADSAKQERYEKYLSKHFSSDEEITNFLRSIQSSNMSEWDRQMEKKEFEQAKKMYKPLKGIMSDRFVTESAATVERETKKTDPDRKGKTIRTKNIWHPVSLLCKRFNIAEPFINLIKEEKNSIVKPKLSVFDYLEASVNNKETFVTPIVIPKNEEIEKSSELNSQSENLKRLSAKDMFTKEVNANKNSKSQEKVISTEINKSIENKEVNNVEITKEQSIKSDKTDKKIIKQKPKTELELKIEELKNKHPSEKKDLYKTVFVSSSESEDDTIDNKDKKNTETGEIISKQNNETLEMTNNTKDLNIVFNKPASEINILRNTSPPRGIFAAFFKDTEIPNKSQGFEIEHSDIKTESENPFKNSECDTNKKIKFKSQSERNLKVSPLNNLSSSDIYGPIIPSNINSSFSITQTTKFKNSISNTDGQLHIDSKLQNLIEKHKTKTKIIEEWVEVTSNNSSSKKNKKDKKKKKKNEKSKHRSRSSSTSSRSSNSSKSSNSNRNSNINHSHRSKKKSKKSKKNKKHRK